MRTTIKAQLLLLPLILATNAAIAENEDLSALRSSGPVHEWQPAKDDKAHNIKAWQKREENKAIRSFKLDYVVDVDLETIGLAYMDLENWSRWWWKVKDIRMLKMNSPHDFIFYLAHHAPVANPDRDVIISVHVEPYSKRKGYATMSMKAIPEYLPKSPG